MSRINNSQRGIVIPSADEMAAMQMAQAQQQQSAMVDRHMLIAQGLFARWANPGDTDETLNTYIDKSTNAATLFLMKYGADVRLKKGNSQTDKEVGTEPDKSYTNQDG